MINETYLKSVSGNQMDNDIYSKLEEQFNVLYPEHTKSTYTSALNFSDDLDKPFQRWFRYKEGYSIDLVKKIIKEHNVNDGDVFMDPFAGSGTTLIAAAELGYRSIGFETNPFSHFLAGTKLSNYSDRSIEEFGATYPMIIKEARRTVCEFPLPLLSFSNKVFASEVREIMMTIKQMIEDYKKNIGNQEVYNLLKLGWLACIEELSNYRKAGNGLKKRRLVKPVILTKESVICKLKEQYSNMLSDLNNRGYKFDGKIYSESCLLLDEYIEEESIRGIIFSPPYANCFDYTEIYKLELWFGDFVSDYHELKELRKVAIRSHLSSDFGLNKNNYIRTESSEFFISEVEKRPLWDKRIPRMLKLYFNDMFSVLDKCFSSLKKDGFCSIVIGNSAYGGVVIPSDLLLAEYAKSIGFKVEKIEIDRFFVPSSQQYQATKDKKDYLRESIICLTKI